MYIALNTEKTSTVLFCVYYINAEKIESIENTLQKYDLITNYFDVSSNIKKYFKYQ